MVAEWSVLRAAYLAAAEQTESALRHPLVAERWDDDSALPDMTVGMLASHIVQQLGAVTAYLQSEPPDETQVRVCSIPEMYGVAARLDQVEGLAGRAARTVRTWAEAGAGSGSTRILGECRRALAPLRACLEEASPDRLIPSAVLPGRASRLDDYLRTRCVELVVHGDDLAVSVGTALLRPDPIALGVAVDVIFEMCRARAGDLDVLLALVRAERASPETLRAL